MTGKKALSIAFLSIFVGFLFVWFIVPPTTSYISDDVQAAQHHIEQAKKQINADQFKDTRQETINSLRSAIDHIESGRELLIQKLEFISRAQNTISSSMLQLLFVVIVFATGVGVLAAFVLEWRITDKVSKNAEEHAKDTIEERTQLGNEYLKAQLYNEMAFSWWGMYEEDFQKFQRGEESDDFIREVRIARQISEQGLVVVNRDLFKKLIKKNIEEDAGRIRAGIINHWTYHKTVELLYYEVAVGAENEDVRNVLRYAELCIELSEDKETLKTGIPWYQLRETGAFSMVKLGGEATQATGRKYLRDMLRGSVPAATRKQIDQEPPPIQWIKDRYNEYCPLKKDDPSKARADLLELGLKETDLFSPS